MRYKMPHAPRYFLAVLCLSASFIVPAAAADATFLPDIPAEQIAADTARSYDSRTGVSIVTAPTFDPFEQDDTVAGTAALRTGPSETTIDGARVVGGAYLDLKMIYTSPSDDPYDLRGYERAYYVSGDPVARITQDVKTLDCASNTTEVVYQDDYYDRYDSYGYLAGIYMLLPRYRGHRGYWSGRTRHRPFSGWSGWRKRAGYGNYGASYGYDYGYDGRGFSRRGYDGHDGSRTGRAEGAAQAAALAQGMAQGIVRKTVAIRGTKTPANAIAVQILSSAEAAETGLISANAALFTVNR
jgi:hypothetical protein